MILLENGYDLFIIQGKDGFVQPFLREKLTKKPAQIFLSVQKTPDKSARMQLFARRLEKFCRMYGALGINMLY
jgi:hypothetical protein